jgi:TetR/AcrR family transcriptional regulator, transcriptional repressor for nem operon
MGRPRAFDPRAVVAAAADLFWERGYQATSIGELETRTGLDRSSLYHAFGSKQALFEQSADHYVEANIDTRLRDMLAPDAGLADVVSFFTGMAGSFRAHPAVASRGCLVVNAVAELASRDSHVAVAGAAYRDRFRGAFAAALGKAAARDEVRSDRTDARAGVLTAMALGLFLSARIDPADAATVADGIADEVASWSGESGPGS